MVVVRGRLTPEVGAMLQRALEAAAERLYQDGRGVAAGATLAEEVTPAQRRADALGLLAECALSARLDAGTAGDRYQVVVHVEAAVDESTRVEPCATGGTLELDHCALHVSAETSRRLACDASVVVMRHDGEGRALDVGRRRAAHEVSWRSRCPSAATIPARVAPAASSSSAACRVRVTPRPPACACARPRGAW